MNNQFGIDPDLQLLERRVRRLLAVQTWLRWLVVGCLWLTLGTFALWRLRRTIALWLEFPTWAALRIGLLGDRVALFCLGLCVAMVLSTLVWQSWTILWGLSKDEYRALAQQVMAIQQQGERHPLWRWVCAERL